MNYRLVSLTCITCKLFEHVICKYILAHIEDHKILTDLQHGFRSGRSCETQLVTIFQDLAQMHNKKAVKLTLPFFCFFFSKAFDTVPHDTWGMCYNAAKCNIIRVPRTRDPKLFNYSLIGQVLEEVMNAKYLEVTLSNDLGWSKHIATMTNKTNSKLSFLHRNLKGCPDKLKQTAYFSLIRSFMEYGATVWDPYQKYNSGKLERVQRRAARLVKSRYSRYSSVSDMFDVLGWPPLSQRRQEARLILFHNIINGLAQVSFGGVLVDAYEGTRRKHNMKFRQIGYTTSQYGQSHFLKIISAWNGLAFAEAPSLAVFRSNFHNN